jgi:hypothetical protein
VSVSILVHEISVTPIMQQYQSWQDVARHRSTPDPSAREIADTRERDLHHGPATDDPRDRRLAHRPAAEGLLEGAVASDDLAVDRQHHIAAACHEPGRRLPGTSGPGGG